MELNSLDTTIKYFCDFVATNRPPITSNDETLLKINQALNNIRSNLQQILNNIITNQQYHLISTLSDILKALRKFCSFGNNFQDNIFTRNTNEMMMVVQFMQTIFLNEFLPQQCEPSVEKEWETLQNITWQVLANVIVQNEYTLTICWTHFQEIILKYFTTGNNKNTEICRMIIFNNYLSRKFPLDGLIILSSLLKNLHILVQEKTYVLTDYLQLLLEYFICTEPQFVGIYRKLNLTEDRIILLNLICEFMTNQQTMANFLITNEFLQYICKDFKKKSDCVLRKDTKSLSDEHGPKEVVALLGVISIASGLDQYNRLLQSDGSLFLNIGSLLVAIQSLGKNKDPNIFTPLTRLEEVAPNSTLDQDFENFVSFRLKTCLVRAIGNLAIHNRYNQDNARDINVILAVLECTHMDARNPLIREWSILAIRNLCDGNLENQKVISEMTKIGMADNSNIVSELSLEMGSLRINPKLSESGPLRIIPEN